MFDVARPPTPETAYAGPHRIHVDLSTRDPVLQRAFDMVREMGADSPEHHECWAFIYLTLARTSWRDADRLRDAQRARTRREERLTADRARDGRRTTTKGTCPAPDCGALVRLRLDGTLRAHVHGTAGGWQSTRHDRCPGSGQPPQTPAST